MDALNPQNGFLRFVFLLSFLPFCGIPRNGSCGFQLMVSSSLMMTILLSTALFALLMIFWWTMGFPVFVFLLSFLLFCRIPRNMSCGFQLTVLSSLMMTILLSFLKETVVLMFGIDRLGRMGMLVWCGMHSHRLECAWTIWTLWKVQLVMHWWCCNLEEKAQLS